MPRLICNTINCTHNKDGACDSDEVIITFEPVTGIKATVECDYEEGQNGGAMGNA